MGRYYSPRSRLSSSELGRKRYTASTMALDWSQCPEVTRAPEVLGGAWVLKGTRVPAANVLEVIAGGAAPGEVAQRFPGVTHAQLEAIFDFLVRSLELTRKERESEAMPVVITGQIDWSQCPGVTRTPDTVSGAWRLENSRLMLECILCNLPDLSLHEIVEEVYEGIEFKQAAAVLEFAAQTLHQPALVH